MNIEELYGNIAPRLTNWLVASGSPYDEACDLVQNTFLKIWKMRDDLRGDESDVSGLAFTIARNLRKNLVRDNARISFVAEIRDPGEAGAAPAEEGLAVEDGRLSPQRPPEGDTDAEYLRQRLSEAFAQLPPILAETYTLFQVGELSIREIAAQTGVSENLVKVRIFRAKEKLAKILADLRVTFLQ